MLKTRDLYVWAEIITLIDSTSGGTFGTLFVEYEVRPYVNVRNLSVARGYLISCKQRIVIPSFYTHRSNDKMNAFINYPAQITNSITLTPRVAGDTFYLIDYSPKTINSSVNSNQSSMHGQDSSSSSQYTTGSSTSETNSYDVSVNVGFSGEAPTGGVSASYGHSETDTTDQSSTSGSSTGRQAQSTSSDSMTIKDWASYGSVDIPNQRPGWVWSQEYPWDVLEYSRPSGNVVNISLPPSVQQRLWDGALLYPPSHLSLFGVSFVSKASWLYTLSDSKESATVYDAVSFTHNVSYYAGMHGFLDLKGPFQVAISAVSTFTSQRPSSLDLGQLALDPIPSESSASGAIVGFVSSQFIVPPAGPASTFSIKSSANNLYITGTGFDEQDSDDVPMQVSKLSASQPATMTLMFKIADPDVDYSLVVKHWKLTDAGCAMKLIINRTATVERHIDSLESGSGTDNVSRIMLRNRDYTSAEFYDYLVMGLNTIEITFSPADPSTSPGYAIRALAVG